MDKGWTSRASGRLTYAACVSDPASPIGLLWEGDVDLVLVMDALVGGPITAELYRAVGSNVGDLSVERSAWRTGGRETDVLITGSGGMLLVEDKIDAPFQPLQPESYREEVVRLRDEGVSAWAVLVCPGSRQQVYEQQAEGCFDLVISLERLAEVALDHAEQNDDSLARASAAVLKAAAAPRPGSRGVDEERSAWGREYRDLLRALAPAGVLEVGPGCFRTSNSMYAWFSDIAIDGLWGFGHLVPDGMVEVALQKALHERPTAIPDGAAAAESAKLWMVRIPVSVMTFDRLPAEQRESLLEAVDAALRLRKWLAAYATGRGGDDAPLELPR